MRELKAEMQLSHAQTPPECLHATAVEGVLEWLLLYPGTAAPIAGGTWLPRAVAAEGDAAQRRFVTLRGIPELRRCEIGSRAVTLGAMLTHRELAGLDTVPGLGALAAAAATSAFPAVRNVATLGGALASGFARSDLVPCLLALEATVTLVSPTGIVRMPVADYLSARRSGAAQIITDFQIDLVPRRRSAYQRLTVRGGAEYPLASVAVAAEIERGRMRNARVAIAAPSRMPTRLPAAEEMLEGQVVAAGLGAAALEAASGRIELDAGIDAPGWYLLRALPVLAERALATLGGGHG